MTEPRDRWTVTLDGATLLGRYHVQRMIGGGGMASVYLATDGQLETRVVVKAPHPAFLAEAGFRERFERETRDLVALRHPHIVQILARGEHDGLPFLVMPFLQGGSLGDRMRRAKGRMPLASILPWARDIARALDFIHEQGVVHRDMKPDNVLFDEHGHAYLSDFGIAKAVGGADTGLTITGATPGSPAYMAPEQPRTSALTGASDQYSFAAALYEALAGRPAFEGETVVDVLIRKQSELPPHLGDIVPELPVEASGAIMRALARTPDERFPTCLAFVEALQGGSTLAATPTLPNVAPAPLSPAAAPATTVSVGRTVTLGGMNKAVWVVFCLLLGGPLVVFMMTGAGEESPDRRAGRGTDGQPPPPVEGGAKSAGLIGRYTLDQEAFEALLSEARKHRPKAPRVPHPAAELERVVEAGMTLELDADGRFRLEPPGRLQGDREPIVGQWQRMDELLVLKPDGDGDESPKRVPRTFEARITRTGELVFQFGKFGIPLRRDGR